MILIRPEIQRHYFIYFILFFFFFFFFFFYLFIYLFFFFLFFFFFFIFFFFFFFVQQFKLGHLSLAAEIPKRHKHTKSNSNTLCVGWVEKWNKQFIRLFLLAYGEIIHACSKAFV